MRQFLLPTTYSHERELELVEEDFHYLVHVLRLQPGDQFPAIDRSGKKYRLEIQSIMKRACLVAIETVTNACSPESPEVVLYQGMPKAQKFDLIVRQATEAGVSTIVPLYSEHSIPVYSPDAYAKKQTRWTKIIREAIQQSGSSRITRLEQPVFFRDLSTPPDASSALFFHQERLTDQPYLDHILRDANMISILVGPEGGLSRNEVDLLLNLGYKPVYLGPTVLRTETAALYGIAVIKTLIAAQQNRRP